MLAPRYEKFYLFCGIYIYMKKILFLIFSLAVFTTYAAADTLAWSAQSMLAKLGYRISVDGAWGPQSQNVIHQFFHDNGEQYDGALDQQDLDILISAVSLAAENRIGKYLPISQNSSNICTANFQRELSRREVTSDQLQGFESVPQHITVGDIHYDNAIAAVYDLTAAVLTFPKDDNFSDRLFSVINTIFEAGVGSEVGRSRIASDGTNETALLVQNVFLSTIAYALLALQETGSIDENKLRELKDRLEELVYDPAFSNNHFFTASRCSRSQLGDGAARPFSCQNHTYGKLHLRAVMGVLLSRDEELHAAEALYRYAIDDLASDGALWREASRGAFSWTYYSHALGHLVGIADLLSRGGNDLWSYQNRRGQSIHDAINFYSDSLSDPTSEILMQRYAKRNLGIEGGRLNYDNPTDLARYELVLNQRYYSEWLPVYLSAFPNSQSARTIQNMLRNDNPPRTTFHYGLNTWCVYPEY